MPYTIKLNTLLLKYFLTRLVGLGLFLLIIPILEYLAKGSTLNSISSSPEVRSIWVLGTLIFLLDGIQSSYQILKKNVLLNVNLQYMTQNGNINKMGLVMFLLVVDFGMSFVYLVLGLLIPPDAKLLVFDIILIVLLSIGSKKLSTRHVQVNFPRASL